MEPGSSSMDNSGEYLCCKESLIYCGSFILLCKRLRIVFFAFFALSVS